MKYYINPHTKKDMDTLHALVEQFGYIKSRWAIDELVDAWSTYLVEAEAATVSAIKSMEDFASLLERQGK